MTAEIDQIQGVIQATRSLVRDAVPQVMLGRQDGSSGCVWQVWTGVTFGFGVFPG